MLIWIIWGVTSHQTTHPLTFHFFPTSKFNSNHFSLFVCFLYNLEMCSFFVFVCLRQRIEEKRQKGKKNRFPLFPSSKTKTQLNSPTIPLLQQKERRPKKEQFHSFQNHNFSILIINYVMFIKARINSPTTIPKHFQLHFEYFLKEKSHALKRPTFSRYHVHYVCTQGFKGVGRLI